MLKDIRPYLPVMIAAFLINVLSLAGIIFSMQVYDRDPRPVLSNAVCSLPVFW